VKTRHLVVDRVWQLSMEWEEGGQLNDSFCVKKTVLEKEGKRTIQWRSRRGWEVTRVQELTLFKTTVLLTKRVGAGFRLHSES